MVYPVAWAVVILVRLLFSKQTGTSADVSRAFRVLLLKFFVLTFGLAILIRIGPLAVPFGLLLACYLLPGVALNIVVVPLGWPRVAYYIARIAWPLGFTDSDAVVACYYSARAINSKGDTRFLPKLEARLSQTKPKDMHGGGVVAMGLVALAKGEIEKTHQLFSVAHALSSRFISRGTRAIARDYLVVDAASSGAFRTAIELGQSQKPRLRWAYFVARASQRIVQDPGAPSNFKLWISYLLAPRRRRTYSLLRRALDASPKQPSNEAPSATNLAEALAALASALRNPSRIDTPALNEIVARIDAALTDAKTDALIERRLLGFNSNESVDAVLGRFRSELIALLVPSIERSDALRGGVPLSSTLDDAFNEARRSVFRELSAQCKDYRRRTEDEDGFDADVEWRLWANFRATAERVLRIDPGANQEVFAETFIPICNFAVLQHNTYKALALAHSMYAWLHRYADGSPKDSLLLSKNMKAAAS
jgi:hypothetical protein